MRGRPADPGSHWDPEMYERFAAQRARPALDLLGRIEEGEAGLRAGGPRVVFDLGCGTGAQTRRMARRWPEARVVGIDHSEEMLERARAEPSRADFVRADVGDWTPDEPADVLFANASLHWLPDHEALFPRLAGALAPGGVLAVQMPLSWSQPSHRAMRDVLAGGGEGGAPLGDEALRARLARPWVLEAERYIDLLRPVCAEVDVWETCYLHVLLGTDAVFEWVKGTGLRPVLAALRGEERERFVRAYRAALDEAYPPRASGEVVFRFTRLFLTARKVRDLTAELPA